ncbi:MAG: hypothetical protein QM696_01900 [Steroidobacteraceae bacterium]
MSRASLKTALAVSLAVASALAVAQNVSSDRRFTPVLGEGEPLYPQSPQSPTRAPQAVEAQPGGVDYRANRAVDRVVVEVDRDGVPADGQSPVHVVVQLFDEQGQPLTGEAFVTVEHSGGRLRLPGAATDEMGPGRQDADRVTSGVQLPVRNGRAEFELLAPHEPQDVLLRVTSGSHSAQGVVGFVPEMRDLIATGLIEGVINFRRHGAGLITGSDSIGDGFERDIKRWEKQFNSGKANGAARTAFFVKGTIKGEYLLTAAYDSDKQVRARLLRDIQPEEFYPVYGDASLRGFDARSAERLYVRVDSNRSYLLYGDFQTGSNLATASGADAATPAPQRLLGTYNRTATGLGWHLENSRLKSNVFAIHDSLRQVVEELAASGSGPYALRNNAVLEGSERVEVVVRDRNQPSRIVSVRPLARLVDYSFEPFSGRILLSSFLPAFDEALNPVSLRITYELDQDTERFLVAGADAQLHLGEHAEVGGSYVEDRNPFAAFDMASANLGYRFGEHTWFVAEAGHTRSEVNTNSVNQYGSPALQSLSGLVEGDAWRVEFGHAGKALDLKLFAGQSDPAFNNPASPLYGGRGEYSLATSYHLTERVDLYAEGLRSEDRNPSGGERDAAGAGTRVKVTDRLMLDLGYRTVRETVGAYYTWATSSGYGNIGGLSGGYATGAGGGLLGYGQQPLDPLTGLPVIQNGTTGDVPSGLPVGTELSSDMLRLGAGYRATQRLQLGAEVEQDIHGEDRHRFAAGIDYQLRERSRLYGRYEQQTGISGAYGLTGDGREANTLALGVDAGFLRDTQLFSEYRLRDAISGRDTQAASGVRTRWDIREGLRMDASVEHTDVITGMVGDSTGLGLALDYGANPLWRGAARIEHRISDDVAATAVDEGYNTTLLQFMAARKLSRDWTLLARNYLLRTAYDARGDVLQNRFQLGVAYRDTDTNRVNALARYEYKLERDESGLDGTGFAVNTGQDIRSGAHIVSTHADWHPSRPWWLTGRVAAKWQRDTFVYAGGDRTRDDFHAVLLSGRVVYDITENWDLGVLGSSLVGQRGANQYALGMEAGRLLRQNLWLSVGYNATGFRGDADLTGYEYTQRGVFLRLRFKFDEDLFRRDEPRYREPLR